MKVEKEHKLGIIRIQTNDPMVCGRW